MLPSDHIYFKEPTKYTDLSSSQRLTLRTRWDAVKESWRRVGPVEMGYKDYVRLLEFHNLLEEKAGHGWELPLINVVRVDPEKSWKLGNVRIQTRLKGFGRNLSEVFESNN